MGTTYGKNNHINTTLMNKIDIAIHIQPIRNFKVREECIELNSSTEQLLEASDKPAASPVPCREKEYSGLYMDDGLPSSFESLSAINEEQILEEKLLPSSSEEYYVKCHNTNPETPNNRNNRLFLVGLLSAVLNYVITGSSPVVTRYLQRDCKVPSMSINAIANISVLVPYLIFRVVLWIVRGKCKRKDEAQNNYSSVTKQIWTRNKSVLSLIYALLYEVFVSYMILWILGLVVMVRSVTNLLSSRFTKATNVQLVNLCAPFIVSILSIIIYLVLSALERRRSSRLEGNMESNSFIHNMKNMFAGEKLSLPMVVCMVFTLLGGVIIILAVSTITFWEFPSLRQFLAKFTVYDVLGMGIALFSTFVLSLNNITLKIATNATNDYSKGSTQLKTLSGENLFLFHLVILSIGYSILSLVLSEDLRAWLHLPTLGYVLFILYALLNYLIGNIVWLAAIKYFGATNTSSILALSLVSTITCSWLILGESVHNFFQIIGCMIVLLSITSFMVLKRKSTSS
jgi:drug/metabolite transporter (DMT)-like permease